MNFQQAKHLYNPDPTFIVKVGSADYHAILQSMVADGWVNPLDVLKREFPPDPPAVIAVAAINRVIPPISNKAISKQEWHRDQNKRRSLNIANGSLPQSSTNGTS